MDAGKDEMELAKERKLDHEMYIQTKEWERWRPDYGK